MAGIAKKVQIGTAACAIAAATLVPLPAAQAEPTVPAPAAPVTQLVSEQSWWWLFGNPNPDDSDPDPIRPFWFGAPNPNPPPRVDFLTFQPLALLPPMIRPFFGWFAALNFEVCFAGLSARIGPYGTITASIGKGC